MEFWQDEEKVAFTAKSTKAELIATVGDVWEQNGSTGPPYKYTASFVTEIDARVYLTAKYPHAVEMINSAVEKVASSVKVTRPIPPVENDVNAWQQYWDDCRRLRESRAHR